MTSDHTLNLDELFGTSNPIVVIWEKKHYEFVRPDALSPAQYASWLDLGKKIEVLQGKGSDISAEDMGEWDSLLTQVLGLLCPDFVKEEKSFQVRTKVLEFYFKENAKNLGIKGDGTPKN